MAVKGPQQSRPPTLNIPVLCLILHRHMTWTIFTQKVIREQRLMSLATLIFAISMEDSLDRLLFRRGFISVPAYASDGRLTPTCLKTGETLFDEIGDVVHKA